MPAQTVQSGKTVCNESSHKRLFRKKKRESVSSDSSGSHVLPLQRINGLSYSRFMYGLKLAGVEMNRKVLADMAVNDAEGFATLAELAKSKIA